MSRRWVFPAVLLVLLFTASLIHVDPGTWGVLRGVAGGRSFVLDPGLHFRIPFFQRLALYPSKPFTLDIEKEVESQEGSRSRLFVHFEGRILRETLVEFSAHSGGKNGPTQVQDLLLNFMDEWVDSRPREELPEAPLELRERFRDAARRQGFEITTLTLGKGKQPGPSPVSGLVLPRAAGAKIVMIGLDGADWQWIDPMIERGELPTLERLKAGGAWANLRSMDPMLSPLLWTTVVTGKPPEEHGVVDFLVPTRGGTGTAPVSSRARKVKALWNIFTEAGLTSDIVAWWATWPAESILGTMVSDRVAFSFIGPEAEELPPGAVAPSSYAEPLEALRVEDTSISVSELGRFIEIDAGQYAQSWKGAGGDSPPSSRDPVIHLSRILASTQTYHKAALDLLSRKQADLVAVYYQGIDEVSHRFAHYAPPKMEMVTVQDYRRFKNAVAAFYRYQDRLLGELLDRVDPQSLVLILSDHGFRNGPGRPRGYPPDIEGQPARWHRPYGIFLASGPMVVPGELDTVSLFDVAPIILLSAGLPLATDMSGQIPKNMLAPDFLGSRELPRLATYETQAAGGQTETEGLDEPSQRAAEGMLENLRALGYIGGGIESNQPVDPSAPDPATAFSHANLAGIYLQRGRLADAEAEARRALEIAPGYLPALVYLAEVYEKEGRYNEALPLAREAVASESPDRQSGLYLFLASLYVSLDKREEGFSDLSRFLDSRGHESDLHSALGILKEAGGDLTGAEGWFRQALSLDAASREPIGRLFRFYESRGDAGKLIPILEAALRQNERSSFHHDWLGLVYENLRQPGKAEHSYREALRWDPEYVGSLINLGNLLARQRRLDEAIPFLERALKREPGRLEARVGLGAALGIQGHTQEAISTLEVGMDVGAPSPALYNALAMAYYQDQKRDKAIVTLEKSLRLDPGQEGVQSLLAEWRTR